MELVPGWALYRGVYEMAQYAFRGVAQVRACACGGGVQVCKCAAECNDRVVGCEWELLLCLLCGGLADCP